MSSGPPRRLFPDALGTHDEDPYLLRRSDGVLLLAFLSDRDQPGNDDIYLTWLDGTSWVSPRRVTTHADPAWYPALAELPDAGVHLAWMRPMTSPPFYRHLYTRASADGRTWPDAGEVQASSGVADDWAPMMLATSRGELVIYFSSQARGSLAADADMDLYAVRSATRGSTWESPLLLSSISDPIDMDVFPFVVERSPGDIAMVFVRYPHAAGTNYFAAGTELWYAHASDALTFTAPLPITHDVDGGFVDSLPALYRAGGAHQLAWTTTAPDGGPRLVSLPLDQRDGYPAGVVDLTARHGMNGYSLHLAQAGGGALVVAVWAADSGAGDKRLFWQVFSP